MQIADYRVYLHMLFLYIPDFVVHSHVSKEISTKLKF